jgi:integrase
MRKKPKGRKYRNLVARGNVIQIELVEAGERHRRSAKTDDWDTAALIRDEWERARRGLPEPADIEPTFAEFSAIYLEEAMSSLADTTKHDRKTQLGPDGPILPVLGWRKLSQISVDAVSDWWEAEVPGKGRTVKTGRNLLGTVSQVLRYARKKQLISSDDPARAFYETLSKENQTKSMRAAEQSKANPIDDSAELDSLIKAAREESAESAACVLLALDAALRAGEVWGLQWGDITWGADGGRRRLLIQHNRPRRATKDTTPKSGRSRNVALSYRLRDALAELYAAKWEPGPTAHVINGIGYDEFRHGPWRRIRKHADLGPVRLKDLRDTFASQLLTSGISIQYISHQLGHASLSVTEKHYAKWIGDDDYREPMRLEEGEVPADLLARLPKKVPTLLPTHINESESIPRVKAFSHRSPVTGRDVHLGHASPGGSGAPGSEYSRAQLP